MISWSHYGQITLFSIGVTWEFGNTSHTPNESQADLRRSVILGEATHQAAGFLPDASSVSLGMTPQHDNLRFPNW